MEHLRDYPTGDRRGLRAKLDGSSTRQVGQPKQATAIARAAVLAGIVKQAGMPSIIGKLMARPACVGEQEMPLGTA